MNQVKKTYDGPYELEGTADQRNSRLWQGERAIRCTASNCKMILGLSKQSAKIRFMRQNLWKLDRYQSEAMAYGIAHEEEALREYLRQIREEDEDATLLRCGLWMNPENPQLACSPDSILRSPKFGRVLVEVKCLTLPYIDPEKFEEMPREKLRGFYLVRTP